MKTILLRSHYLMPWVPSGTWICLLGAWHSLLPKHDRDYVLWNIGGLLVIEFVIQYFLIHCYAHLLSCVWCFVTSWSTAHQAPLFMEFSRQEYYIRLLFPTIGYLPDSGLEPVSSASPALAGGFFTTEPPQRLADCFYKDPKVNIFYFMGYIVPVMTTELCHCSMKQPQIIRCGCVPIILNLQKQVVRRICPMPIVCQTPSSTIYGISIMDQ